MLRILERVLTIFSMSKNQDDSPPDTYWHYTSFDAFEQIIKTDSLRMTRASDIKNYHYEIYPLVMPLYEILSSSEGTVKKLNKAIFNKNLSSVKGKDIFDLIKVIIDQRKKMHLTCFGRENNIHKLWDEYAKRDGVCIGFKSSVLPYCNKDALSDLRHGSANQRIFMYEMIYDKKEIIKRFNKFVQMINNDDVIKSGQIGIVILWLSKLSEIYKDSSFKEEKEIRLACPIFSEYETKICDTQKEEFNVVSKYSDSENRYFERIRSKVSAVIVNGDTEHIGRVKRILEDNKFPSIDVSKR